MEKQQIEEILENAGFENDDIFYYLESLTDNQCHVLSTDQEVIDDFLHQKEQQEILTDKIMDSNYYSVL